MEVSRGLRVQFPTRQEWIGLLVGKSGNRIRHLENTTGCTIRIVGGARGAGLTGDQGRFGGSGRRGGTWYGGGSTSTTTPCRVAIAGPDAESVQKAREQMEFAEASMAVGVAQVRYTKRIQWVAMMLHIIIQQLVVIFQVLEGFFCEGYKSIFYRSKFSTPWPLYIAQVDGQTRRKAKNDLTGQASYKTKVIYQNNHVSQDVLGSITPPPPMV